MIEDEVADDGLSGPPGSMYTGTWAESFVAYKTCPSSLYSDDAFYDEVDESPRIYRLADEPIDDFLARDKPRVYEAFMQLIQRLKTDGWEVVSHAGPNDKWWYMKLRRKKDIAGEVREALYQIQERQRRETSYMLLEILEAHLKAMESNEKQAL